MTKRFFGVALIASLLIGPAVRADDVAAAGETAVNNGKVSLSLGADITNEYFFRGIVQEDQGVLFQPWAEVGFALTEKLSFSVGIWNSFHEVDSDNGGRANDGWYEADLYFGLSYALTEQLSVGVTYTAYTSPNNLFSTVEEVAVSLAYDDSALWGDMLPGGLQPSMLVAFETDGTADGLGEEGIYLELGIEPSFDLAPDAGLSVSFPVTVGIGLDDYYEIDNFDAIGGTGSAGTPGFTPDGIVDNDDNWGYAQIGIIFSMPMKFIPAEFGEWEAHAGINFLFLGNNAKFIDPRHDDVHFIGLIGFGMSY
jgi:uncharacterized protein (TIGR02001 family)